MKPTERFSDRVETYVRYRPSYPDAAIALLRREANLHPHCQVADIGCGPGNLTRLLAPHANHVFAIEPNPEMRAAGEQMLSTYPNVTVSEGTAENTGLPDASVDLITCAQAFHWFELGATEKEFRRILAPGGAVGLIWNMRKHDTPFLKAYSELLRETAPAYQQKGYESHGPEAIKKFFTPGEVKTELFEYVQYHDREAFVGRVLSSSYAPLGDECFVAELNDIFEEFEVDGQIEMGYTTEVYLGRFA